MQSHHKVPDVGNDLGVLQVVQRPGTVENIGGVEEAARAVFDVLKFDVVQVRLKKLHSKQTREQKSRQVQDDDEDEDEDRWNLTLSKDLMSWQGLLAFAAVKIKKTNTRHK